MDDLTLLQAHSEEGFSCTLHLNKLPLTRDELLGLKQDPRLQGEKLTRVLVLAGAPILGELSLLPPRPG